ncbi:lysine transporter LysE [Shewanella colwelliana]|uniref:LysE family translocator n=1 Tax=Shewanella colwelliana TaxID=23 RepID=UPI001BBB31F6|nr:LysE family translocator [Shewanella colwelliana]MDX1282680.1 LysE family translocator [Shewanella colwelliana]GIU28625.1 lysine transporter LysE [Shewanella colwelliana]
MNIDTLIVFAGIVFLIAIVPGPNALLVLFTALTRSRTLAFSNILGVSSGFMVHAFISAQGLSLILSQSSWAFLMLKYVGVAYLTYLGISSIRAGLTTQAIAMLPTDNRETEQTDKRYSSLLSHFTKGFLTNMLNPKIILFYLSIFPQFVSVESVVSDSLLLGGIQSVVVSSWFLVVIMLAQKFKALLNHVKAAKAIRYLTGGIFLGFSIKLASTKL